MRLKSADFNAHLNSVQIVSRAQEASSWRKLHECAQEGSALLDIASMIWILKKFNTVVATATMCPLNKVQSGYLKNTNFSNDRERLCCSWRRVNMSMFTGPLNVATFNWRGAPWQTECLPEVNLFTPLRVLGTNF